MSSFDTKNNDFTCWSILIFVGLPLLLSGQLIWGGLAIAFALAARGFETNELNKIRIRFDNLNPEDVLDELERMAEISTGHNPAKLRKSRETNITSEEIRIRHYNEGLSVLGRKHNQSKHKERLSLRYQQLAFTLIRLYPQNDQVVAGSISLLILIAKDTRVRKRFVCQPDVYGLNQIIDALKMVLVRAKKEEEETKEAVLAEILRKGCLLMGAICNEDEELCLAKNIVSEGGLELILKAADWYRLHEELSNWALWALFTLSYNNLPIKAALIEKQGIQIICRLMENNPNCLEVNRHGTAILFDLLRVSHGEDMCSWNRLEIRKIALASGLHNRILTAMSEFSDSMEIMMMGKEILIDTGYVGEIPRDGKML